MLIGEWTVNKRTRTIQVLPHTTWFINLSKNPVYTALLLLQQPCSKNRDRNQGFNLRDMCEEESGQLKRKKKNAPPNL